MGLCAKPQAAYGAAKSLLIAGIMPFAPKSGYVGWQIFCFPRSTLIAGLYHN